MQTVFATGLRQLVRDDWASVFLDPCPRGIELIEGSMFKVF